MELAPFPDEFLREIEKHFRASVIHLTNPLDLGDLFDLDLYGEILERTLRLDGVDGVVFLHTAFSEAERQASRTLCERIIEMVQRYDKPVAFYFSTTAEEINRLRQTYSFPLFTTVVETIRALEMSYTHYQRRVEIHQAEPAPTLQRGAPGSARPDRQGARRKPRPAPLGGDAGPGKLWHSNRLGRQRPHS